MRDTISLTIQDVSQFTKTLRSLLPEAPGHQETLGLIARAAGYRNFQHLRAANPPAPVVDQSAVTRALRAFDKEGRLAHWPSRTSVQHLCLWALWAQLPARHEMTERQISAALNAQSTLQDAAQLRRSMVEAGLVTRDLAGQAYCRVEQAPSPEARALLAALREAPA